MAESSTRTLGLSEEELARVRALSETRAQSMDRVILAEGIFTEQVLHDALAAQLGLDRRANLSDVHVPEQFMERVPFAFAKNNLLVAVGWDDATLLVATATPLDYQPLDEVGRLTGAPVRPVLASGGDQRGAS